MKRFLCVMMAVMILFPFASALGETKVTNYDYTFIPGPILEGEGMDIAREVMNAIVIRFTRQISDDEQIFRLMIISEGEEAFSISASESGDDGFEIVCSMLGDEVLQCERGQLTTFLQTIVQMLGDLNVLREDKVEKFHLTAERLSKKINEYLDMDPDSDPDTGIDLKPYLQVVADKASAYEERIIPEEERDSSGAVKVMSYLLNEEERKQLVDYGLSKINSFPLIGTQMKEGKLRIGGQVITEEFIREILAETPGEMTLDLYLDGEERLVRMLLRIPDLHGLVTDEQFAEVQGVELSIVRDYSDPNHRISDTTLSLPGLEGTLVTVRLEKAPGDRIEPLSGKEVHKVGELDS